MDVKELVIRGEDRVVALICGKCGIVWGIGFRDAAEECCDYKCKYCGVKIEGGWTACKLCRDKKDAKREKAAFDKADKVNYQDYPGEYLYSEAFHSNDGYVPSDDILYEIEDIDQECRPTYAWACEPMHLKIDAQEILENELQEFHEDAIDYCDIDGLQKLLDEWLDKQSVVSYFRSNTVVLLDSILAEAIQREKEEAESNSSSHKQ